MENDESDIGIRQYFLADPTMGVVLNWLLVFRFHRSGDTVLFYVLLVVHIVDHPETNDRLRIETYHYLCFFLAHLRPVDIQAEEILSFRGLSDW
jgi:hypothetical protein